MFARCLGRIRWRSIGDHIFQVNEEIRAPLIRVIGQTGFLGDHAREDALKMAGSQQLDLVVVNSQVAPVIGRLIAWSAFESEFLGKRTKSVEDKEAYAFDPQKKVHGIRLSMLAQENDYRRKIDQCRGFIEKGHRVEVILLTQKSSGAFEVEELVAKILGDTCNISKPANLPLSPESLSKLSVKLKLWPCTPEQAQAFKLPRVITGLTQIQGGLTKIKTGPNLDPRLKRSKPDSNQF